MKKLVLVLPIILVCALTVEAAGPKTMTRTIPASDIETLDLNSGVGDVTITARDGLDEVAIEVVLTPRRGGIFSSKRQAELDVEAASLEAAVKLWLAAGRSYGHEVVSQVTSPFAYKLIYV